MSDERIIIEPIRRYELSQGMGIIIGRHGFILTEDLRSEREHRGTWEYRDYESVSRHETVVKLRTSQRSHPAHMLEGSDNILITTTIEDAEALERDLQAGMQGELRSD